ncbi:MAG: GNAT family N-acetyltransferase [Anaerolineales bacterium]|jgi:RimJ/RimL family protein N-acetyltransferase
MTLSLLTPRLALRPLQPSDAGAMFCYRSRPDVWRYQIWKPAGEAEVRTFIEGLADADPGTPGTWLCLAITSRERGEMIGDVGLRFPEREAGSVEIGITLSPAAQKQGFAAETLEEVFRFLFLSLGIERIFASIDPRNSSSLRLMRRLGMRREAHIRGGRIIRGETVDDVIYAIRKKEFSAGDRPARA